MTRFPCHFDPSILQNLRHNGFRFKDEPLNDRLGPVPDGQGRSDVETFWKLGTIWNVGRELKK
jgi:hypothetical protein